MEWGQSVRPVVGRRKIADDDHGPLGVPEVTRVREGQESTGSLALAVQVVIPPTANVMVRKTVVPRPPVLGSGVRSPYT